MNTESPSTKTSDKSQPSKTNGANGSNGHGNGVALDAAPADLSSAKHPKGLYVLFFTEMWERLSYYGMRALLVLYMIKGLGFAQAKSSAIYGIYTGLVYFT